MIVLDINNADDMPRQAQRKILKKCFVFDSFKGNGANRKIVLSELKLKKLAERKGKNRNKPKKVKDHEFKLTNLKKGTGALSAVEETARDLTDYGFFGDFSAAVGDIEAYIKEYQQKNVTSNSGILLIPKKLVR